jgi:hypothetical protein
MTPEERTVEVLNRWSGGDNVDQMSETLEQLWNRTKPTGKPSHSGIDFFPQGASDLVNRLVAEFQKSPARNINFTSANLNPTGGTILTVDNLLTAVIQSPAAAVQLAMVSLSPESHDALVKEIVQRLQSTPVKKAAKKKADPAAKSGGR